jgi:D-methionine transport system substrate-binding protein
MEEYFMKKKIVSTLLVAVLSLGAFTACGSSKTAETTTAGAQATTKAVAATTKAASKKIVVGASPTPHADILKVAAEVLAQDGYQLEVKEFVDYVQPNLTLESKDLDANYFQHKPYLDNFNTENKTHLVSIADIHYEPFGIYPGKTKTLADLKDGATVSVPNDTTNEARALLLLESQGLIKLKADAGLKATKKDIIENPKKLEIKEVEAAAIAVSLKDVDIAVINGNYALTAGLSVAKDAIAKEDEKSLGASTFANILVVRQGDENREDLKALAKALKSEKVKKYIEEKYKGAVVPLF